MQAHLEQQATLIRLMELVATSLMTTADGIKELKEAVGGTVSDVHQAVSGVEEELRTANLLQTLTIDPHHIAPTSLRTLDVVQDRLGIQKGAPTPRSNA
jgi:hypothetical protein